MKITINNLQDVFKSKKASVEMMELKGYQLIDELFVDSSGFGADDEPAMTKLQFETKLQEIVAIHGTVISKITKVGQFQVYVGLFKKTGKAIAKKIDNNTYRIETSGGYKIRLHDTDILTFGNGEVTIRNGGYYTKTTKDRINKYLPRGLYMTQKDFRWLLIDSRNEKEIGTLPFGGVMTIGI